ncbi:MAG: DUF2183 domain-containing protein, partial [Myxococcales bacterium]|nr:DUF2183 domain-containing protein [Myxococcales bacterium]
MSGRTALTAVLAAALLCSTQRTAAAKDPVAVLIYDGIGTTRRARVWGRVLEDEGLDNPRPNESRWRRFRRSIKLLESDELPYARVELTILGKTYRVRADKEGLFAVDVPGPLPVGSHRVSGRALGLERRRRQRSIDGRLLVYPAAPRTLVISDIDDTVLQTGVKRKLRMVWKTITSNFYKLKTYRGAPALYQRLRKRGAAISFVSGSPINLYPRLRGFLALKRFPRGPLLLKNIGTDKLTEQIKF